MYGIGLKSGRNYHWIVRNRGDACAAGSAQLNGSKTGDAGIATTTRRSVADFILVPMFGNMKRLGFLSWGHAFIAATFSLCLPMIASADSRFVLIDMLMGEPVPMEALLEDLAAVRIVYVGEVHSIARHHLIETEILRLMDEKNLKPALGMEMFGEEQQPVLDKWQSGTSDFAHLMRDLGLDQWTNLQDYEPLIMSARERKIPIVGLNAPDALVRKIARNGIEGLSEEERRKLPDAFEEVNPLNDRLLRLRLRVHRAFQDKSLDRIVLAQALRDGTMARAISRFLESERGRERIMLAITGSGHVNYGFGIPERVRKRGNWPFRIILLAESGELVLSEAEKRQAVPVEITHEDLTFIRLPIADYLFVTPLQGKADHMKGN